MSNEEHEEYDDLDDDAGYDEDDFDCGESADGTCSLAGTEQCDWQCPYNASRLWSLENLGRQPVTPTESSSGEGPNALSNEGEISKTNKSEFKKRGAGHGN